MNCTEKRYDVIGRQGLFFFAADVNFLNPLMYLCEEAKEYPLVANVSDQYKLIYEMFSRGA